MGARRIAYFDNLKGVLIALVVFGHFAHPVHNDNPVLSCLFDIIYLFHMPLFVFISGLFAKGAWRNGRLNVNRIISFFALGLAYQLAIKLINGGPVTPLGLVQFSSAPWYLIAMGWWYLATPVLARLGFARSMAVSIALSLLSGCLDMEGGFLAIMRSLAFLPWFAAGYFLDPDAVRGFARKKALWVTVAAACLIAASRVFDPHAYDWFFQMVYGDVSYDGRVLVGMVARCASWVAAALLSLAVMRIATEKEGLLATLGRRTLPVYVLHRLIRAALTFRTGFYALPILLAPAAGTLIIAGVAGVVVTFCALPLFEGPFNRLMGVDWTRRGKTGR